MYHWNSSLWKRVSQRKTATGSGDGSGFESLTPICSFKNSACTSAQSLLMTSKCLHVLQHSLLLMTSKCLQVLGPPLSPCRVGKHQLPKSPPCFFSSWCFYSLLID